jgi:hypothetical protein
MTTVRSACSRPSPSAGPPPWSRKPSPWMKASLDQTTLVAVQRLAGALFGAVAAALVLLIPTSEHGLRLVTIDLGLQVVALVILINGVAIRFWNYALYCGAIAAEC